MERDAGLRRIVCSSPNDGDSIVSESSHESIAGIVDFFEYRGSVLVGDPEEGQRRAPRLQPAPNRPSPSYKVKFSPGILWLSFNASMVTRPRRQTRKYF